MLKLTTKFCELDVPPPGDAFRTVTAYVPAEAGGGKYPPLAFEPRALTVISNGAELTSLMVGEMDEVDGIWLLTVILDWFDVPPPDPEPGV